MTDEALTEISTPNEVVGSLAFRFFFVPSSMVFFWYLLPPSLVFFRRFFLSPSPTSSVHFRVTLSHNERNLNISELSILAQVI